MQCLLTRTCLAVTLGCMTSMNMLCLMAAEPDVTTSVVVDDGKAAEFKWIGPEWTSIKDRPGSSDALVASGQNRWLLSQKGIGAGDFQIRVRLQLARLDGTAAAFDFGSSRFGLDSKAGLLFVEGPLFRNQPAATLKIADLVQPDVPFLLEMIRTDEQTRFLINGQTVYTLDGWKGSVGRVGLRPWRNEMAVFDFSIKGNLYQLPAPPEPLFQSGFAGGTEGYHTYRIPSLTTTRSGTLLALCEGRKNSTGDSGNIDLVMKRSTDGGQTWSEPVVLWDDGENTCGNPCLVVDQTTGELLLLATWNLGDDHESEIIAQTSRDTRRVYVLRSKDDGLTWSHPVEITKDVKQPDWTWYATGPGGGIQIQQGSHAGRLVIPCDHIEARTKKYYSHVIYSDDHGQTWKLGGSTPAAGVNECEVVELTGGKLLLNMRNASASRQRQTSMSEDGGLTWSELKSDAALIEPVCQAAILRASWPTGQEPGWILFSNPASTTSRTNLTVRGSRDDGQTWPYSKVLYPGPSAYSDLALLPDGRVGCLFEAGEANYAESIVFVTFGLNELTK